MIGERAAVGVAPEVLEHVFGAGEGALRLHDPVDRAQPTEEAGEGTTIDQWGGATREGELAVLVRTLHAGEILGPKDGRQRADGKQKRRSPADPPRALRRQGTTGDQAVQMQVLRERLSPRVQDGGDSDRAAEMPRIASEGEQRVGGRAEEQRVDHPRIALRERVEIVRQREDDVEIRDRQQVGFPRRQPAFLCQRLTLRAVAIATGNGELTISCLMESVSFGGVRGGARGYASGFRLTQPALHSP